MPAITFAAYMLAIVKWMPTKLGEISSAMLPTINASFNRFDLERCTSSIIIRTLLYIEFGALRN